MNRGQLKSRVYGLVGDLESTPLNYPTSRVEEAINRAYGRIARDTGALEDRYFVALTSGTRQYSLPEQVTTIFRAAWDGEKIFPATHNELDLFSSTWQSESGDPIYYHVDKLDPDKIALFRTPETTTEVSFESELGTVIDLGTGVTDVFALQSYLASLGEIVNLVRSGNTVTFAAAGSGGGADIDYGIAVGIAVDDASDTYSFDADLGVIVNMTDGGSTDYDGVVFSGGGQSTNDEFGIVIDIDAADGSDEYVFDSELGVLIDWDDTSETLEIWAHKDPEDMLTDTESPELPIHSHLAIAYLAASELLQEHNEAGDDGLAKAYVVLAGDYVGFLKNLVGKRAADQRHRMRSFSTNRQLLQRVRLPSAYPRTN